MNKGVKISVVVPVCGVEKYLRQCVDSILAQTMEDIEVLLVDDGSTDASPQVLADYADKDARVRVISQENAGVSAARNAGMLAATGEFIAFLDPDDFLPDKRVYEDLYRAAKEHNVKVCGGSVHNFVQKRRWLFFGPKTGKILRPKVSWGYFAEQAFTKDGLKLFSEFQYDFGFYRYIFNRKLLVENQIFFPPYVRYQDPVFCAQALDIAGTFYALARPSYIFREDGHPSVDWSEPRCICDQLRGFRDLLKFSKERGYAKLHWLQLHRLFEAFKGRAIAAVKQEHKSTGIPDNENSVIALLNEIDSFIDTKLARRYKPETPYYSANAEFIHSDIKVSVIIPVYNVEKYLRQCLDSIINQTLKEIEIICVDDGSTDGSLSILKEYAAVDSRIIILRQKNQFAGVARNNGMKIARGKYLSFLDSDDVFDLSMLEKMLTCAEKKSVEIAMCRCEGFDEMTGEKIPMKWSIRKKALRCSIKDVFSYKDFSDAALQFCLGWTWDKIFVRKFIQNQKLEFQALRSSNDAYFTFVAVLEASRITVCDEILVYQRRNHKVSLSQTRDADPTCCLDLIEALLSRLKEESDRWRVIKKGFYNWVIDFLVWHVETLGRDSSREKLKQSFYERIEPSLSIFSMPTSYYQNRKLWKRFVANFGKDGA